MLSTVLSFLGVSAAVALNKVDEDAKAPAPPPLPKYKHKWWWEFGRLDARPVAWSLRNHPEQWERNGRSLIVHLPSRHKFMVGSRPYRLYHAHCGCHSDSTGRFHRGQGSFTFGPAYLKWKQWDAANQDVQRSCFSNEEEGTGKSAHERFCGHFVN